MACSVSVVVLASSIKASTSGVVQKQRLPEGPRASVWYMDRSMESGVNGGLGHDEHIMGAVAGLRLELSALQGLDLGVDPHLAQLLPE